jgi:hypothetical protein
MFSGPRPRRGGRGSNRLARPTNEGVRKIIEPRGRERWHDNEEPTCNYRHEQLVTLVQKQYTMVNVRTALSARCTVLVVLRHRMARELQSFGAVVKSSQNAFSFEYVKRIHAKQGRNLQRQEAGTSLCCSERGRAAAIGAWIHAWRWRAAGILKCCSGRGRTAATDSVGTTA